MYEYLVTVFHARIEFRAGETGDRSLMFNRAGEGHFEDGKWVFDRVWKDGQVGFASGFG